MFPLGLAVFMSELRTEWFAVYRAAMVEADPHQQPTLVEAALDLMRRRARRSRLTGHRGETLAVASAPLPSQEGMATGAASAN